MPFQQRRPLAAVFGISLPTSATGDAGRRHQAAQNRTPRRRERVMCQVTFEKLGARCLASALAVILCSCSSANPVAPTPISAIEVASTPPTASATANSHSAMTAIPANAMAVADAPAAPTSLQSRVSGKTVTLTWSYAPIINRTDASFVIQVGSAPGQSDLL